jgi:Fe-S-cluster-containing dehydrogenase component/DMSO reductase anchor subunit
MRSGFIFDMNKCVGCEACVVACQIENFNVTTVPWRSVSVYNEFQHPALPLFHFSLACNHCDDARCMAGCPANAFRVDPILRTVDHDPDLCIGCRYCTWTCPYEAPRYVATKGVVEKCTLCKKRIAEGRSPNCVNLCPTGALEFGELDPAQTGDLPGFAGSAYRPAISIVSPRKKDGPLTAAHSLTAGEMSTFKRTVSKNERKSTLITEWPLVVFTFLAALLVGGFAAETQNGLVLNPLAFLVLAAGGMAVSTIHLGKPLLAWRAMLNTRTSWLSREVVLFAFFAAASGVSGFLPLTSLREAAVCFGIAALISIDMVYVVVERRLSSLLKSGSVILTGILFFAAFTHMTEIMISILVLKAILYMREFVLLKHKGISRVFISSVRVAAGFAFPLGVLAFAASNWMVVAAILVGESLNRVEFFLDLDILTPRKQIGRDLLKGLTTSRLGHA